MDNYNDNPERPSSLGCILIHRDTEYNDFADAVGFKPEGVEIEKGVKEYIPLNGYVVIDRTERPNW